MDARESLRQAFEALTDHPRQVLASAAGVFWGAAAIVLLLAWGTGFREFMHTEMGSFGRGFVMLFPAVSSSGFEGYREGRPVRVSRADLRAAERDAADFVELILPHHASRERLLTEGDNGQVRRLDLSASDERFLDYRGFEIEFGRGFDAREAERGDAVAVLGPEAAADLFGSAEAAVGKRLRVSGRAFRVIGVPRTKGRQYFNTHRPDNRLLIVPAAAAEARLGFDEIRVGGAFLFPRKGVAAREALHAAFESVGPRGGFHPDDEDAIKWFDSSEMLGIIDLFYAGFMVFIGVAGTLTLLIGGVGIANYHLATIAQRSVEIGVARAIGARSRTLVIQTVLESLLVSGTTAAAGVGAGVAGCALLAALTPPGVMPQPILSPIAVGVTFVALLGVATIAALLPALRVRQVEITEALRAS